MQGFNLGFAQRHFFPLFWVVSWPSVWPAHRSRLIQTRLSDGAGRMKKPHCYPATFTPGGRFLLNRLAGIILELTRSIELRRINELCFVVSSHKNTERCGKVESMWNILPSVGVSVVYSCLKTMLGHLCGIFV